MRKKAVSIDQIVGSVIAGLSGEAVGQAAKISQAWERSVGKKTARFCKPASFKKGRLTIHVAGSSWMYELNLKKNKLRETLNKKLKNNGPRVKQIILRISNEDMS